MSKINPWDIPDGKIEDIVLRSAHFAATKCPEWMMAFCESPIETLFLVGAWSRGVWTNRLEMLPSTNFEYVVGHGVGSCVSVCAPQVTIDGHRVDFLFAGDRNQDEPRCLVAVECDGHEFHERTKEQAAKDKARDRDLARRGIVVMRFTGSEVWADAGGCAEQVISFIENEWHASSDRFVARVVKEFGSVEAWRDAMYQAVRQQ